MYIYISKSFAFMFYPEATIGAFVMGSGLGWSSPALPALSDPSRNHPLDEEEASWVGSLFAIGALIASQVTLNSNAYLERVSHIISSNMINTTLHITYL